MRRSLYLRMTVACWILLALSCTHNLIGPTNPEKVVADYQSVLQESYTTSYNQTTNLIQSVPERSLLIDALLSRAEALLIEAKNISDTSYYGLLKKASLRGTSQGILDAIKNRYSMELGNVERGNTRNS